MNLIRLLLIPLLLFPALALAQFQRALPGYEFSFPRDHGSHPDFQTEWWYFTGNLTTKEGRDFGYELTIFRTALVPPKERPARNSTLYASQIFFGHFAISDIEGKQHQSWERIGREGLGQAEASTEDLRVRLADWTITRQGDGTILLHAASGEGAIDLTLAPEKPFILHGKNGVHQKSGEPGQASHYISFTRLNTEGTIRWQGETFSVQGRSWMDHEFGSDQLSEDQVGWDWFALQLDNGEDLMVYELRRKDGTPAPQSSGSLVAPGGERREITSEDYEIETLDEWKSPHSGAVYPMKWRITVPDYEGSLTVIPAFEDQEMLTEQTAGTTYWEGAVHIEGRWRGKPISGKGYVELVGYAEEFGQL